MTFARILPWIKQQRLGERQYICCRRNHPRIGNIYLRGSHSLHGIGVLAGIETDSSNLLY